MTSRPSPDDADRSGRATAADGRGGRTDSRARPGRESAEKDTEATLRARLSDLGVALVALAVLLSFLGAAATGPAAAGDTAAVGGDPATVDGGEVAAAVTTDDETEPTGAARREISGSFSRPLYTGTAGDPVEIRHALGASGNDSAYLLIGGNRLTDSGGTVGFVDVVKASGGSTTINTRLIGTNESDVDSCGAPDVDCDLEFRNENGDVIAENLSGLSGATGAGGLARPLAPQRYRLAVTNGTFVVRDSGAVDPVKVAAESDLVLREPTFHDEVEVFTTVDSEAVTDGEGGTESLGALRENGLDRSAVTKGDRVVLGFESTGIWGALSYFAERRSGESIGAGTRIDHRALADLIEAEEGVSLRIRQTNPGRNERRSEFDLASADPDDVTLYLAEGETLERGNSDRAPSRFYLAIDTSDGGPFTEDPEPGDEFSVEFALEGTEGERYAFRDGREPPAAFEPKSADDDRLSEQYPYHESADGRVSAEASFGVRERYLRYDHATADGDLLVEADDGTITGTTSVLPVTDLSATIVRDGDEEPSRTESELTIDDGNFSVDSGLANVTPGTEASYRLYQGQSLQDSRTILVVDDAENPAQLRLANGTTTNLTVTRGESLSNLTATVRNVGQLRTRERLSLDIGGGAIVEERHVTVGPGASKNETFGGIAVGLEPGEYPYVLSIDGHSVNGTLTVEADPSVTRVDDPGADDEGSTAEGGGEGAGSDSDDGDADDGGSEAAPSEGGSDEAPDDEAPQDAPATFLPFGVGTRETFGGTVLVGATYLLGHWV